MKYIITLKLNGIFQLLVISKDTSNELFHSMNSYRFNFVNIDWVRRLLTKTMKFRRIQVLRLKSHPFWFYTGGISKMSYVL